MRSPPFNMKRRRTCESWGICVVVPSLTTAVAVSSDAGPAPSVLARLSHSEYLCDAAHCLYDRALYTADRGVPTSPQGAQRQPVDRRPNNPAVATQSPIQSHQAVSGSAPRADSLQTYARARWLTASSARFDKHGLAECELPRICRLHADRDVQTQLGPLYRVGEARARRADVRRGRLMALPSIIDC